MASLSYRVPTRRFDQLAIAADRVQALQEHGTEQDLRWHGGPVGRAVAA